MFLDVQQMTDKLKLEQPIKTMIVHSYHHLMFVKGKHFFLNFGFK